MTEQGRKNIKLCQKKKNKEKIKKKEKQTKNKQKKQTKTKKKNAVINQKGGKTSPLWYFPPNNLDTTVALQKTSLYQ